jgi:Xaa-Pro aminopeptidase
MGNGTGGWQLICERRFEGGYRPARDVTFAPGMTFSAAPHLCTEDWAMITIVGNTVIVTEDGSRIAGAQGIDYRVIA